MSSGPFDNIPAPSQDNSDAFLDPTSALIVGDAHFAEQFPLSPLDDYLIHQTPDPIRACGKKSSQANQPG